ncbi:MAG: thioredoxin domain-containing protein [Ferruginibacter sp.]
MLHVLVDQQDKNAGRIMDKHFTNRLINETSPYLLQHAHNPVDWFAWGDEALSKAKAENKIILVSIGYSACHWCHVMERESFENQDTAQVMNGYFINIKIDREERPDLDHIYMDAIQAISGSGGWPLNVFLTPDAKPFFGGTYFPPVKAYNRPSWTEILHGVAQAWKDKKEEIQNQADYLTEHIQKGNHFDSAENAILFDSDDKIIGAEQCDSMFSAIMASADREWGGFGNAPKFPQTFTIGYLLQYHYFTGNKDALQQGLLSIDKMMSGGIYDHISGGLARYSTDKEWLAPHFEKMLYDNALLINILCDAYQLTSDKKYEEGIRKTISFITEELLSSEGGFYAALDADSEGEEGKYYVWQKEETDRLLGRDAELFNAFFNVSEEGNWEGSNILRILKPVDEFVQERRLDKGEFLTIIEKCLQQMSEERHTRVKPALDDKIILSWNALMLHAIARAASVLQDNDYRDLAERNFDFLKKNFTRLDTNTELLHTYKDGQAKYPAFLDDYANLVTACIQLYKTTLNAKYLQSAKAYCNYLIENFSDEDEVFFYFTHRDQKDVIVRKKEIYDGATPSGNAVMAGTLLHLSIIFNMADWRNRAFKMLKLISPSATKYPVSFGIWSSIMLQQVAGFVEIAVVGPAYVNKAKRILLCFMPNQVLMASEMEKKEFPLLEGKPGDETTRIYLCKNYACLTPFLQEDLLMAEISKTNKITS